MVKQTLKDRFVKNGRFTFSADVTDADLLRVLVSFKIDGRNYFKPNQIHSIEAYYITDDQDCITISRERMQNKLGMGGVFRRAFRHRIITTFQELFPQKSIIDESEAFRERQIRKNEGGRRHL